MNKCVLAETVPVNVMVTDLLVFLLPCKRHVCWLVDNISKMSSFEQHLQAYLYSRLYCSWTGVLEVLVVEIGRLGARGVDNRGVVVDGNQLEILELHSLSALLAQAQVPGGLGVDRVVVGLGAAQA